MRDQSKVKKEEKKEKEAQKAESTLDQIAQSEIGSTTPSEARKIFFPPPPWRVGGREILASLGNKKTMVASWFSLLLVTRHMSRIRLL